MTRWLPILIAALAVLALAAALVPSGFEQAFMQLRDQDFPKATDSFARRWNAGDHSREVANALSELLVRKGEPARAADILRAYVAEHPDDRSALTRLAEIFRDDQQRDAYIAPMEALWKKDRHTDVLRCLVALYDDAGRDDDQLRALSELVRARGATIADFEALAKLQSVRDPRLAMQTLYNAFHRWSGKVSADTAEAFAVLASDADRTDLIRSTLLPWFEHQAAFASIEPVANALSLARHDDLALAGVLKSAALAKGEPLTVTFAARLEAKTGHWQEARDRLKPLYIAKTLPTQARDIFLQATMRTDERRLARDYLLGQGPAAFPFWLQSWTIAYAMELADNDFLTDLRAQLSARPKDDTTFFRARLELALGDRPKALALAEQAEQAAHSPTGGIAVASLMIDLANPDAARTLLSKYAATPADVAPDDLMPATEVALGIRDTRLALELATRLRSTQSGEPADILYARALGQNGQTKQALAILEAMDHWSDAREQATFEVLKAAGQMNRLQALLLERMGSDTATVGQRTNYTFMLNDFSALDVKAPKPAIDALVDDLDDDNVTGAPRLSRIEVLGKASPDLALPYARTAAAADPAHAAYLLLALLKQMKRTEEAITFISGSMAQVDGKTRQALMFDWIALGVTKPALPYLKELAAGPDRQWFFACDEALQKLGERNDRIAFLTAYAQRTDIDTRFRSELASELLETGAKAQAIDLFKSVAATEPPRSPAVEQLLFLWGPRPPAEAVAWMTDRARTAPVADQTGWLDRLVEAGAASDAARIASGWYAKGNRQVATSLAAAFAILKSRFEMRTLATSELQAGNIIPANAARLAEAAEELDLPHEASALFELAAAGDSKWIAAAGRNAWYGGEQTRARRLLEQAAASPKADEGTLFLLGEAISAGRDATRAQELYQQALTTASKSRAPGAKRIEMLSLVRLHRIDDAERLVAENGDAELRQDYAAALLDGGNVPRATRVLAVRQGR